MNLRRFALILLLVSLCVLPACGRVNKQVSERDKLSAASYYQLALNYFSNNQIIEALQGLKDANGFNPRDPQIHNLYGLIYLYKNMLPEAEKSFKSALLYDPKFSDAALNLAAVFMAQEKWKEALAALKLPAEDIMYRDKDKVFDNLGWCYHKLGDTPKAIMNLNNATMENERNCHAWYNLGMVYAENKRYKEASGALSKVTTYCTQDFMGFFQLAQAALKSGDLDSARPALERCVALGRGANEAQTCKEQLKALGGNTVIQEEKGPVQTPSHLSKPTNL